MSRDDKAKLTPAQKSHIEDLQQRLSADPVRQDVRLMLLKAFYECQEKDDFIREARIYRDIEKQHHDRSDWGTVLNMGRHLAPFHSTFISSEDIEGLELEPIDNAVSPDKTKARPKRFGEDEESQTQLLELSRQYAIIRKNTEYCRRLDTVLSHLVQRPTPLYHAARLSAQLKGARIYLKREDSASEDHHLHINIMGQVMWAASLKKKQVIVTTINGTRGVYAAAAAARWGLHCKVYADSDQLEPSDANMLRMKILGAEVYRVAPGYHRNKDIREAAKADWLEDPKQRMLVMGLDGGPDPYPSIAADMISVIGRECEKQMLTIAGKAPSMLVARDGDNADIMGLFPPLLGASDIRLVCVASEKIEPSYSDSQSARNDPFKMRTDDRQRKLANAILEGLEYPSVTRERKKLRESGRLEYVQGSLEKAKTYLSKLARLEGIIAPIETAHAIAWACEEAQGLDTQESIVVMFAEAPNRNIWELARLKDTLF